MIKIYVGVKMTRVIAVASGKGGVGKTTVSANLGIALSMLKEDVLVLDMDINMGNLELILGLEGQPVTLQDVLSGEEIIHNAIYEGPGGVRIVPAGLSINNLQYVKMERMESVIEDLIGNVEILIIDTPAGLEKDAMTAMSLADEMILVTTPDITSISDTLKTKIVAEKLGIKIWGVVLNREHSLNRENSYDAFPSLDEIESILESPIIAVIPENFKLQKSYAAGDPLIIKDQRSSIYYIFLELAGYIVGKENMIPYMDTKGVISRFIESFLSISIRS